MDSSLWNVTSSLMSSVSPSALEADTSTVGTVVLISAQHPASTSGSRVGTGEVRSESSVELVGPSNGTRSPYVSSTSSTAATPLACAGYAAATVANIGDVGNHTYHHADNHTHAIIYIGVILAFYFSALTVLIVRYVTKERQCYVRSAHHIRTLKKSRSNDRRTRASGGGAKDRFLGTGSRQTDMRRLSAMQHLTGGGSGASCSRSPIREPQPLQLIVPTQSTALLTSTTALVHMDTAV